MFNGFENSKTAIATSILNDERVRYVAWKVVLFFPMYSDKQKNALKDLLFNLEPEFMNNHKDDINLEQIIDWIVKRETKNSINLKGDE